jgi:3-hydroxyisobutyrate dehydrogenase-like beta-hydroxyacid dehydrogenase
MKVTFLGLGSMGMPMAANVAKAGHALTVWNRTRKAAEGFEARVAETIADAVREAEIVLTMLADDGAVQSVIEGGLLEALPADAVHVSMSTISIGAAKSFAAMHADRGRKFVSAPVFGRPDVAAGAKLWAVVAGDPEAVEKAKPVIASMTRGMSEFGAQAWHANLVKIGNNLVLAAMIEILGETAGLMRKADIAPADFFEAVNSLFQSPVYANYGRLIAERKYEPGLFKAKLGLKDVRLALDASEQLAAPLPIASLAHDNLVTAVARGRGDWEWTALAGVAQERAGLD